MTDVCQTNVFGITSDGNIFGINTEIERFLDVKYLGDSEVERISDIKWCKERKAWYVEVIKGTLKGHTLTRGDVFGEHGSDTAYFKTRKQAEVSEVLFFSKNMHTVL